MLLHSPWAQLHGHRAGGGCRGSLMDWQANDWQLWEAADAGDAASWARVSVDRF